LEEAGFLTNETIFNLTERPEHLIVIGGGPIGCELAQAFCRLGSRVTLTERSRFLPREDPEASAILVESFRRDGIEVLLA
jgi:pyruvate/2-oxoglutarate dehydrogenase complex dihydrolipoamide dehydrogenase (E3) component